MDIGKLISLSQERKWPEVYMYFNECYYVHNMLNKNDAFYCKWC